MGDTRITINGQHYDSPDAMPPDVRRTYEDALRTLGSVRTSGPGGSTQVFTSHAGWAGGSLVVKRVVAVNNRTYGDVDELPPDVRQKYEDALGGAAHTRPKTGLHVSVNVSGPETRGSGKGRTPPPVTLESSSLVSKIRDLPASLAFLIVIGLILWILLGRY